MRPALQGFRKTTGAVISGDAEDRLRGSTRRALKKISVHNSKYLNNRIEQDHR
jgi:transposase-like protein